MIFRNWLNVCQTFASRMNWVRKARRFLNRRAERGMPGYVTPGRSSDFDLASRWRSFQRLRRAVQRHEYIAALSSTERLEDRTLLTVMATVDGNNVLNVSLDATETAFITNSASGIRVGTTANGTDILTDTMGIVGIAVTDAGPASGQTVNFDGSADYNLTGFSGASVSVTGIETINVNETINGNSGSVSFSGQTVNVADAISTANAPISLTASDGVTLNGTSADVTTGGGMFTVDADSDSNGSGDFTSDDAERFGNRCRRRTGRRRHRCRRPARHAPRSRIRSDRLPGCRRCRLWLVFEYQRRRLRSGHRSGSRVRSCPRT